eukprot:11237925-Karenia_brevis.AAC.1
MCQVQCPRNDEVEVENGVSCESDMRQRGVVEVPDADAHTYQLESTECELLAGAEPGTKRKW